MFSTFIAQWHRTEAMCAGCKAILVSHVLMLACSMRVCASIRAQQIGRTQSLPPQSPSGSLRALSQRRAYMDSGWLAQDQAVIAYMKKLELHKYASMSSCMGKHGAGLMCCTNIVQPAAGTTSTSIKCQPLTCHQFILAIVALICFVFKAICLVVLHTISLQARDMHADLVRAHQTHVSAQLKAL